MIKARERKLETKFIDSLNKDLIGSINLINTKIFYYLTVEAFSKTL